MRNYQIAAKKRGDGIVFLRKIVPGGADQSYGVEVARLAGVPDQVVNRAREILTELEAQGHTAPPPHIFWIKIVRKTYNNQYVNVYLT